MKSDKKRKNLKRDTQIIILSVLILTIISLNFSYSAFFSIDSRSTVQEISTGTLNVTATPTSMWKEDLYPTDEALPTDEKSTLSSSEKNFAALTVTNNGTIDANYVITLSYDTSDLTEDQIANDLASFDNLIIGIYDTDKSSWVNLNPDGDSNAIYNMKITQFAESSKGVYPILKHEILKANITESETKPTIQNLRIYVWLADTTPESEIGKLVHLKINVRSTPLKGQNDQEVSRS